MTATLAPPPEHPQVRSCWGLFAQRDFRLLWAGQTVSRLGSSVTTVALPLVAVLTLGAGPLSTGLLTGAIWLPWLLFGLPAGVWVGRAPRRAVMIGCNLGSAALFASVPVAGWFGGLTMAQLLAVAFLGGVCSVFFDAADQAYLPELVAPEGLIEGNAKLTGGGSAAEVAGRGLAGLIVQFLGAAGGLLVDAVSFLVAAATLLRIRARSAPAPLEQADLLGQVREGLSFLLRDPYLRAFLCFGAAANFALMGYQSILPLFLVRSAGIAPGWVGALASAAAVGGVLGSLAARPLCRRLGTARGTRIVLLTVTPFGLLMPLAGPGAGDVFYERAMAARFLPFLERAAARGATVIVGDPGRAYLPRERFTAVAAYQVPVVADLEDASVKTTTVWRLG
ncbi:MFS transporter [Kitasatospora aureofaciens]|uniref:MFS transporter n=1 Tax=Kitasatospora aureofaciens TaxID=1894 RepID=UPI00131D5EA0|nr:MFS transporter [Kitasatospora aureofaciens]